MTLLKPLLSLTLLIALLPKANAAEEPTLFRYRNDQGVPVISSTIPPKFVRRGYDIITFDGRVLKTVPPELSPEQRAKLLEQQQEEARLKAWDQDLLRRYSHPDDIEAAKQRRLAQNQNAIGIVQRTIEKIDSDIVRYQGLAAADEREGRAVNGDTLEKIAQLKQDRVDAEQEIAKLEQENQLIIEKFDKDIARFKEIKPSAIN